MKKLYIFLPFLFFSCLFGACSEDFFTPIVDLDIPEHTPRLVVYGNIGVGEPIRVYIARSRGALDTTASSILYTQDSAGNDIVITGDTVKNVTVSLFKNGQLFTQFPTHEGNHYYAEKGKTIVDDGAEYKLVVSAPNYTTVEAIQRVPQKAQLDSVVYRRDGATINDVNDPFGGSYKVDEYTYKFKDPTTEQYYQTLIEEDYSDYQGEGRYKYLQYSLDPIAENDILSDKTFNGKAFSWRVYSFRTYYGEGVVAENDTLRCILRSVTTERAKYNRSLDVYLNAQDNPLAEPVILYSNLKNGYGIFSIFNESDFNLVIKRPEE